MDIIMVQRYRHTPDMGEISGFGGGYEKCCQDMLEAGVLWMTGQDKAPDLHGHTFKNIYGLFKADSDDAKAMEKVVLDAAGGDATGAMHHAVMSRLFYINQHGWDRYCEEVRARTKAKDAAP